MRQSGSEMFRRKVLTFTCAQMVLLSVLLVCAVVLRIFLFPLSYLESVPLYIIVGIFFLAGLFQLFYLTRCMKDGVGYVREKLRKALWIKGVSSVILAMVLGLFFTRQYIFFLIVLMMFLAVETLFDIIYFGRLFRDSANI